jgi:hypothetical protein
MRPRISCSPPTTKALPQSDVAKHEQNDDHGSYKPDDVVHDALLKFDTPFNSRATRGRDQLAKRAAASSVLSQQRRAALRQLPAVRECVPRGSDPRIVGARRV